jgi:hypothetical protein
VSLRTIAVGRAPAGSKVEVHVSASPDRWIEKTANQDGYAAFVWDSSLSDSDIRITAAGYKPYLTHVRWKPENHQVNIGLDGLPPMVPLAPPLPHLQFSGIDCVDAAGNRTVLNGTDAFCAFRQFRDQGPGGLMPFVEESHELGFTMWRVFMQGSKAQNTVLQLDPHESGYYDDVRPFADYLNSQGLILLATVYVDEHDIHAGGGHWLEMANRLRGSSTLLSGGNEWKKNGFDPGTLADPNMLWSRGSDLSDVAPFVPYGAFAEFHPRRDLPASIMDTVASPVFIYGQAPGQGGLTHPLIIDEPPKFGTSGSSPEFTTPRMAYRFARHYATECAGACFHNFFGQRGMLMDTNTRACAQAWTRGMRL